MSRINFGVFLRCAKSSKCSWQLIIRHISQNYQLKRNEVAIMVTKPEFLVTKEEMLVAL